MAVEARSVVVRLTAETAQYIAQMQSAGRLSANAMKPAEAAVMRQSAAIDDLGGKAGKLGLAAAAGLGAMAKAAVDWESEWAGVSKTVSGTSSQLDSLEDDLRGLARSMPATHQEIAATAEAAGQLGVATDDVTDFTKVMVEMGSSTNLSAEDAATSIAQFMNVMQTVPDEVDEIGNVIVDLGNKGASTESQITDMAQRVAGVGTTIGATEQDVLGLSAAMANLGIQSELGGGAVQRVLLGINTDVKSGSDIIEQYAEVAGTSAEAFAQAWSMDPIRAFDMLVQGLGKIQDSGGDVASILDEMGIKGTQNLQVMLRLAGSGDMLTRSLDQADAAWDKNSALTREYGKRAETTASQAQVAWNKIKDAGIEAGGALLPVIAEGADMVGSMADAFRELPGPVQDFTTAGLAVTALLGGGLWFGAKVVNGITTTRASLAALRPEIARVGTDLATRSGVRQFTSDLAVMATTSRTAGATTERELARTQAAATRVRSSLATVGIRGAGLLAGLTLATTDFADGMSLSNTASYALMGTIAGPWGAAIGGGIGLIKDFRDASKDASSAIDNFNDSLDDTDISKTLSAFQTLRESARASQSDFDDVSSAADLLGDSVSNALDVLGGTGRSEKNAAVDDATKQLVNLTGVLQGVAQANGDVIASATGPNGWSNLPYGDLEDLARVGEKVQPVLKKLGYSLDDLMSMKPGSAEATKAIREINDALAFQDSDAGRIQALGDALDGVGDVAETAADKAKDLKDALDALLDPQMDLSAATDEWTTALRHLTGDLDKNNKTLQGNSDAAITNRAAIRDRVDSMKDLLVAEADAGARSGDLSRSLRSQRKALIDAGEAAGISRKDMRDYLDVLGLTPDLVKTIVQADISQAQSAITSIGSWLDSLDGKTATTWIRTIQTGYDAKREARNRSASGSFVPDDGGPYTDRFPYLLAPGEGVTTNRNGETDRFRDVISGINAGFSRSQIKGMLADGRPTLDDRLAIAQATQRIHDLEHDLHERIKKGRRKGEYVVQGISRRVMTLELQKAREDLREARQQTRQQVAEARSGLSLTSGLPLPRELTPGQQAAQSTRGALADFAKDVKDAGGTLSKGFKSLTDRAATLSKRYADNADRLDKMRQSIEDTTAARDQLAGQVTGGLTSDLWASTPLESWLSAGVADPLSVLNSDIANTQQYLSLAKSLNARGLDGDAFTEAAANGGLAGLQVLNSYSDAQLAQYASLYQQRHDLTTAAGLYVGNQQYGAEIAKQTAQLTAMVAQQQAMFAQLQSLNKLIQGQANAPERTGAAVGREITKVTAVVGMGAKR